MTQLMTLSKNNLLFTFTALTVIMFGFAIDAYAQRFVQRTPQRNVQRDPIPSTGRTPDANHVTFGAAAIQPTRQSKVETVTVEITPQDRMDYHNAARAYHSAVAQLKQRYHGSRDFAGYIRDVNLASAAQTGPLVTRIGVDKFDALQAEYRMSVTTFESIFSTAADWGQRNINRNPRGFNGVGIMTNMDPRLYAELSQDLAREIQNYRTTDRVQFVREIGGPRGVYELIPISTIPIQ